MIALINFMTKNDAYFEPNSVGPFHDPVGGPDQDVVETFVASSPPILQLITVEVQHLQALDPVVQTCSVKAIDQLELRAKILFGQVVKHARIDQTFHECRPILG